LRALALSVLLAHLLLSSAMTARAQAPEAGQSTVLRELSMEQLGNIVVTSISKEPEEVWRTPAAIDVITQEDIRRSGATSLPQALRLAPGVEVARIDSDHWAIGIRGFGDGFSKSVLVLIDGRSVYTPLFAGVFWGLQDTRLEDIERIEVIRGPGGTIWGSNAVNGVINVITKSAQQTHGWSAIVTGGNVDQGIGSFRYGAGNGNFDYRLYGKIFSRGAQFHTDQKNFDTWRMGQMGFRADWVLHNGDNLTIQGDSYRGGQGQRVGVGSFDPPAQRIVDGAVDVSGSNLLVNWRRRWSSASDTRIQAYYDRTDLLAPQFGEVRNTLDFDVTHHITWQRHNLIGGVGARWSPARFVQTVPTLDFEPHKQSNNIYSAFAQDEIAVVRGRLFLTVGSKLEHNNYGGLQIQPTARLLWRRTPKSTAWLAVTRALRAPSRIEKDLTLVGFLAPAPPLPIYVQIDGDKDFQPERLVGYEAGYRTLVRSGLYVDVSAFHNQYNDLLSFGNIGISIDTEPPPTRIALHVPWANGIQGTTDGVEIAPVWSPAGWWQLKGFYAYLHFALENKPGNADVGTVASYEGSSPQHQVVIRSTINLPKAVEFDQTYRYTGALPAQAVDSYHTVDARLGWQFIPGWEVSLVGQDLLRPQHVEFQHDPGPAVGIRRSVYVQIHWRR
jgi:iron complex outermembrane receptor protein